MKKYIFIIMFLIFLSGCSNEQTFYTDSCLLKEKHNCQEEHFIRVDYSDYSNLIDELDPVILDVRTEEEYAMGHIEGSILIPDYQLSSRIDEISFNKKRPIFVYCRTNNRAAAAARILKNNNFESVYILNTGYDSIK